MGYREIRTALLQDAYAHVDGKDRDIGHLWLQHADPLKNLSLSYGDRIRFNCRVSEYKRRLQVPNKKGLMVENRPSLCWPTDVKTISRLRHLEDDPDPQSSQPEPCIIVTQATPTETNASVSNKSPVALISEVKVLMNKLGGWEELHKLIEVLRSGS